MRNKKMLSLVLTGAILTGIAGIASAADFAIAPLSVASDKQVVQGAVKEEKVLVLRGEWIKETAHQVSAEANGEKVDKGDVTWSVDSDSYKDEFGFTGKLTGDDIVSVDAKTGKITAKKSGIVRVWCTSNANPEDKSSVVVVVPGDVNRDGVVDLEDVMVVFDYANGDEPEAMALAEENTAMYQFELANMATDDVIDLEDAMAIMDVANGDTAI